MGSHYHFIETNRALSFDRSLAYGRRLDVPAGTAIRFEPGESKTVSLVSIAGKKRITGGNGIASGYVNSSKLTQIVDDLVKQGFSHTVQTEGSLRVYPYTMERKVYADFYGPTTGDRIRLGNTDLWLEIEKDYTVYGDECKFGGGKVLREGMGQATGVGDDAALDLVITNAIIVDYTGIYKVGINCYYGSPHLVCNVLMMFFCY